MFASTIFYKVEHADENYLFQLINIVSLLPRHQQVSLLSGRAWDSTERLLVSGAALTLSIPIRHGHGDLFLAFARLSVLLHTQCFSLVLCEKRTCDAFHAQSYLLGGNENVHRVLFLQNNYVYKYYMYQFIALFANSL
jgi:hypothetical protein